MLRIVPALLACAALAACATDGGQPDPVPTGSFDGYDVVAPCTHPENVAGVVGRGSTQVVTMEDLVARGGELLASVEDVTSVWGGSGRAAGCQDGYATTLMFSDARDTQELVDRAGAFVRERDLAMQVVFVLGDVPVAD